jgi:hypothetical protein
MRLASVLKQFRCNLRRAWRNRYIKHQPGNFVVSFFCLNLHGAQMLAHVLLIWTVKFSWIYLGYESLASELNIL